jgi:PAS domain S-box-containing protein
MEKNMADNNIFKEKTPLILIVDDVAKNLQVLGTILSKENYKIAAANNGEQAISIANNTLPDLILLDIMMPGINGYETCARLKKDPKTRDIPIIFLTAKIELDDIIKGFEVGAVDYITKPFNSVELLVRTKTHLELKISRDLLEEKALHIRKEKNKIETIIQSIDDGVFVVDKDLIITLFNPKASQISGFSEKEVIGQKYYNILKFIIELDNSSVDDKFIKDAVKTGKIQEINNHTLLITKKGNQIPVADSAAPLINEKGQITGCVVVFRDITKDREIEKMKSEFVSITSHQLKTPLTGIKWMTELLLRSKLNKEQMEYANYAHDSTNRLVDLIDDLLDVSHIETGRKFDIQIENIDVIALLNAAIGDVEKNARKKNISISKDKGTMSKLMVNIDPDKIRQVISNLIDNAVKYSKQGGTIELNCVKNKKEVVIFVRDHGIGIPQKQQKRLFEKFFRADNAVLSETDGTGLGLYIVKAIVGAHNGKIWFDSVENKGTTFYIKLPM